MRRQQESARSRCFHRVSESFARDNLANGRPHDARATWHAQPALDRFRSRDTPLPRRACSNAPGCATRGCDIGFFDSQDPDVPAPAWALSPAYSPEACVRGASAGRRTRQRSTSRRVSRPLSTGRTAHACKGAVISSTDFAFSSCILASAVTRTPDNLLEDFGAVPRHTQLRMDY
jgi:hypothetical protein